MAKKKRYVVRVWHKQWVFDSRDTCKTSIHGYQWAKYKSFGTKQEAIEAFGWKHTTYIGKDADTKLSFKLSAQKISDQNIVKQSIAVDAACSGNPGILEYQWVETVSWKKLFRAWPFAHGTVNIWEFLAIVDWLKRLQNNWKIWYSIYSDSTTAIWRIKKKRCNTQLQRTSQTTILWQRIDEAHQRLAHATYTTPILKRKTKERGEIPADFGRK